ncbi:MULTISPECIES: glutaredoxin family protein [unclassified Pseudactinotalea]|uniref:glutaredoxin family protein n=1 Tax=unclassified Pseudactinotalea TaxID=2649176 RepID=UPI00128CAF46|nr:MULTISPECIES: glutaredoxin family protein [unclassified Pseudactinotalea]MPV50475.1 glutaredoxin family protein [Pseudactinotalea sp. HY160]QGH70502.1 glutaredoxin family protein [Pseudactinotalea sp. HY158]
MTEVRFYTRAHCHLCEEARRLLSAECARAGLEFAEIDVDSDPELRARYGEYVPVVVVDDTQVGYWRIEPARLRAALGSAPGHDTAPRWWRRRRTPGG